VRCLQSSPCTAGNWCRDSDPTWPKNRSPRANDADEDGLWSGAEAGECWDSPELALCAKATAQSNRPARQHSTKADCSVDCARHDDRSRRGVAVTLSLPPRTSVSRLVPQLQHTMAGARSRRQRKRHGKIHRVALGERERGILRRTGRVIIHQQQRPNNKRHTGRVMIHQQQRRQSRRPRIDTARDNAQLLPIVGMGAVSVGVSAATIAVAAAAGALLSSCGLIWRRVVKRSAWSSLSALSVTFLTVSLHTDCFHTSSVSGRKPSL